MFIAVVSTNPATLLGYGTWVAFAMGRTLVGLDTSQTEFDVVEETGGSKSHTLDVTQIPAHTHTYVHTDTANSASGDTPTLRMYNPASAATGSAGGGLAHNNLQPYVVVYMWKRTA